MKWCNKCKQNKKKGEFYKNKYQNEGLCTSCIKCYVSSSLEYYYKNKEKILKYNKTEGYLYHKEYYQKNKDIIKKQAKEHYLVNIDKILKRQQEYSKTEKYQKNCKERRLKNKDERAIWWRKYKKERRKTDIKYKLNDNFRSLVSASLKGNKLGKRWSSLVGYGSNELKEHLEKQFDNKMNWDNYGSYWWVDHIKPVSLFNFIQPEDKEFKDCWSLSNLQPLEKIANIKKGNKYE